MGRRHRYGYGATYLPGSEFGAYRAAAWIYALDAIDHLRPEFAIEHGTWRRGPFDHQRRRLDDLEIVDIDGVLVTSIRQTLADLCAVVDLDIVERAAESALRLGLVDESPAVRPQPAEPHQRCRVRLPALHPRRRHLPPAFMSAAKPSSA